MNREAAIKLEARLTALEFFATKLGAAVIVGSGGTVENAEIAMQQQLEREQTFPTLDPVVSNLLSAELNEALERLLKMQVELVAEMSGAKQPE